ncbi:MAG: hypothetical protein Q9168_005955 [Polycauliona sp. 1 TL-2023]
MALQFSLIVPDKDVKTIKTTLEAHNLLDKHVKISPAAPKASSEQNTNGIIINPPCQIVNSLQTEEEPNGGSTRVSSEPFSYRCSHERTMWFSIPILFEIDDTICELDRTEATKARKTILERIGILDQECIGASMGNFRRLEVNEQNPLLSALQDWLHLLDSEGVGNPPNSKISLDKHGWTYNVYSPMLLLPSNFLSKSSMRGLLARHPQSSLPELWRLICRKLKVTHLAINKPIPAKSPDVSAASEGLGPEPNALRSPTNLMPVHGDFGEKNLPPTEGNFQRAFWVSTVQNDITQVWPPLYTMFSRGNISEKARLLRLLSPASGADDSMEPSRSSAVDLYAGIGYFAFSYAKAGFDKVLCWELNGWSIEGLKRGAKKNGWTTKVYIGDDNESDSPRNDRQDEDEGLKERLLIFNESNRMAAIRIEKLRSRMPPIRHVNCGYLPSSSDSWDVAVQVLDPWQGGWIHAHENVGVQDIDRRKSEIVDIFRELVDRCQAADVEACRFHVACQHVEQVKAYAPGVMHLVFDFAILPNEP